jgi:hypothetical protein
MNRRRFLFWISMGMFTLAEELGIEGLDELAAATIEGGDDAVGDAKAAKPTHWRAAHNSTWQWYERETLRDGRWVLSGITTPIHRKTGEPYTGAKGYLDESLVRAEMRILDPEGLDNVATDKKSEFSEHQPDPQRRARHGRPPSKWLRSLRADELRIWLKTIDVPEAGVVGMTYWDHLTQDHFFNAEKIAGLNIDEQAKLHAAAHHGY